MVRPVARFRPAARRTSVQLDPVWVLNKGFSDFNSFSWRYSFVYLGKPASSSLDHLISIYSGSAGLLASVAVFEALPYQAVAHDDGGVRELYASTPLVINRLTTWDNQLVIATAPLLSQVVDEVVYASILRGSASMSNVKRLNASGQTVNETGGYCARASYEVFTVAVNIQTGAVSCGSSKFIDYQQNIVEYTGSNAGTSDQFKWTSTTQSFGLAAAYAASLPAQHPFKSCGAVPWEFLDSNAIYPAGTYSGQNFDNVNGGSSLDEFHSPSGLRSHLDFASNAWNRYSAHAGYNTQTRQRVFSPWLYDTTGIRELSTVQALPGGFTCEGYRYLGATSNTSFASYSPEELQDFEDVVELSGLEPTDLQSVVAGSSQVAPPEAAAVYPPAPAVATAEETYISQFGFPAEMNSLSYLDTRERLFRITG